MSVRRGNVLIHPNRAPRQRFGEFSFGPWRGNLAPTKMAPHGIARYAAPAIATLRHSKFGVHPEIFLIPNQTAFMLAALKESSNSIVTFAAPSSSYPLGEKVRSLVKVSAT